MSVKGFTLSCGDDQDRLAACVGFFFAPSPSMSTCPAAGVVCRSQKSSSWGRQGFPQAVSIAMTTLVFFIFRTLFIATRVQDAKLKAEVQKSWRKHHDVFEGSHCSFRLSV